MPIDGDENPYASPLAVTEIAPVIPPELWRFNDLIVAHRQAVWPRLCVKTGATCDHSRTISIATHFPNWFLLPLLALPMIAPFAASALRKTSSGAASLLAGYGVFAVLVVGFFVVLVLMIFAKHTKIEYFVSPEYLAQRRTKLWLASGLIAVAILVMVLGILPLQIPSRTVRIWFAISSAVMSVIGGRYFASWQAILTPTQTKPEYIVLRGCGEPFLSTLPTWPYGPI